jgi:phosphoribosylanthranilate isomerase
MKVKICGITRYGDAQAAIDAGADLLGFNFYPKSPRYIDPLRAARVIAAIRVRNARVQIVGVFVNSPIETIARIMDICAIDLAQLSGDEPPETLVQLNGCAFKALRPKDEASLPQSLISYPPKAGSPAFLVDAYRPGKYGGTGQLADWTLARSLAEAFPVLLAGGLNPENVSEAIWQVHPWGVDVASGVEDTPRRKDRSRMAAFIKAAKGADLDIGG